ncbi:DUF475 domain-containing protein [Actinomadura parmotrematis]|uniref:DUF475 domain-containing protein n=1 Tax=Actinomadura parmotrematis TaxID=2864039 RepID=A0ABS7FPX0_9ACTN|nr:DUF475 domain-containing protein [Actinomadura parmotrematis]MBW8482422.1 DUF475 domain-containing protein [Actinomadura parmotrematis]
MITRTFAGAFVVTLAGLAAAFLYDGSAGLALVAVLAVLEISLSFDNAVVNAKVLDRMSPFWQKVFLTVGVAIAVFGMRLVFPLLIVGITARLGPGRALDLALHDHARYQHLLEDAYPMIAAFGGMFLMMLFLEFVFADREERWLTWLERPLARLGALDRLPVVISGGALVLVASFWAADAGDVMVAGVLGMVTYVLVNGLGELFAEAEEESEERAGAAGAVGKAAFFLFVYLEVLDASFSFDGVIGAFAISTDPIIIAIGLGIGAMYIRSLTVFLVRKGTLHEYVYLEHGAHWAIGALAVCMLVSVGHEVPEWLTGGLGAGLIIAAFAASVVRNRREAAASASAPADQGAGGGSRSRPMSA